MPWIITENGERKYSISIYAKEELPTWGEVYDDFYLKKSFIYDPVEHQELDLYWKIPRRKYLLATVCNQFNKMLFENGIRKDLINFLNKKDICRNIEDIRFICETVESYDIEYEKFLGSDTAPPIYTFPLPSGLNNPFIISNHPRIDINTIDTEMMIVPIIKRCCDDKNDNFIYIPRIDDWSKKDYEVIIDFMIRPFKTYFEGTRVGWKDEEDKLLQDLKNRNCNGVGYDPAL